MKQFDKIGLIKSSWEILKKNTRLIAILMGAFVVFNIVQSAFSSAFKESPLSVVVSLAFSALSIFFEIGFIKIVLKLIDGHKAEIQELWAYPQYFINLLVSSILYGLIVGVGFILLVVPGIYLALRLQFYSFYVVDKNAGITDSLKMSWEATKGNTLNIFLFVLILIALNILGAIALLVGLLVTIPVSFIAVALLYRKLSV